MKKALSIILVLIMVFSMTAQAFAYMPTDGGYTVTIGEFGYIDENWCLWLWGPNTYGEAGIDPAEAKYWVSEPHKVADDVVAFSQGDKVCIFLKSDGSVWTMGNIIYDGKEMKCWDPIKIMDGCIAVSAGFGCFGALKSDGSLYTWGENQWGQTGYRGQGDPGALPQSSYLGAFVTVPTKLMDNVAHFEMNYLKGFAVTKSGDVVYWGLGINWHDGVNYNGQLSPGLVTIWKNAGATQIDSTRDSDPVYVLKSNGEVWGWGLDLSNQGKRGKRYYFSGRSKIASNVKYLVGTLENETMWHSSDACFITKDDSLYIKNGAQKLDNDVNMAVMNDHQYNNYVSKMVLYDDGTLIAFAGTTCDAGYSNREKLTENKVIATNVALSHQPISTAIKSAVTDTVAGFTDVHTGDWFAETVAWAVDAGITDGTSPTTFSPSSPCTYGHILTFLWRANGCPAPKGSNKLAGVKNGQWYTDACVWAYENGILTDEILENGFDVTKSCPRMNVVEFIYNSLGRPDQTGETLTYLWADVPSEKHPMLNYMYRYGIVEGVGWGNGYDVRTGTWDIRFGGELSCTRAQIMTFLYRTYVEPLPEKTDAFFVAE